MMSQPWVRSGKTGEKENVHVAKLNICMEKHFILQSSRVGGAANYIKKSVLQRFNNFGPEQEDSICKGN